MTILNNGQREELLKEMKALAEKYGIDVTEKMAKERTDIQKDKDTIFSLFDKLDVTRITDSVAVVKGEMIRQTETIYGDDEESTDKIFKEKHPHAVVIKKSYIQNDKNLCFRGRTKYIFDDLAYYRIQNTDTGNK